MTASIASAQSQVEAQNFEIRKYPQVRRRDEPAAAVYGDRRKVLEGADVESRLRATVDTVVEQYVIGATEGFAEDWDLEQLWSTMNTLYPVSLVRAPSTRSATTSTGRCWSMTSTGQAAYDKREESLGEEVMRELERRVLLTVLDRKWREHLYEMDYLREGIGLRAMAQRDPLVEYQREGGAMFSAMMEAFMEEVVGYVFHLDVEVQETTVAVVTDSDGEPIQMVRAELAAVPTAMTAVTVTLLSLGQIRTGRASRCTQSTTRSPDVLAEEPVPALPRVKARPRRRIRLAYPAQLLSSGRRRQSQDDRQAASKADNPYANVGRNAPCPCGSGKKFKMCHGRPGAV